MNQQEGETFWFYYLQVLKHNNIELLFFAQLFKE
jgi:hypothetical protein